jgi:hypothetical protein
MLIKQFRQMLADLSDDIPVRFEIDIDGTCHSINIANYKICFESSADNVTELVLRKKNRYKLAELLAEMPHVGEDADFARELAEWDNAPAVGRELEGWDFSLPENETLLNFMLDQLNHSINRTSAAIDNSLEFVESSNKRIELLEQSQEADVDEVELKKCVVMLIKKTAEARQELKEVDTAVIELRQRAAKRKEIDDL